MRELLVLAAAALVACAGCDNATRESRVASCEPVPGADAAPTGRYIYMAPDGSDGNPGTHDAPVATLDGVQAMLRAERPDSNVFVRIASDRGPYDGQSVVWDYVDVAHSIVFESWPDSVLATFRQGGAESVFFLLESSAGRATYLQFRRLRIEGYAAGAIWFAGDAAREAGWNGGNSIVDCVMENIGNAAQSERPICWGVVDLVNSRHNVIRGCSFIDCANANTNEFPTGGSFGDAEAGSSRPAADASANSGAGADGSLAGDAAADLAADADQPIIGIYLAHGSSCNEITGCTFSAVKGDAVRFRDASNENEVCHCLFRRTGWTAVCTAWYLRPSPVAAAAAECPSWSNLLHDNRAEGNWLCGEPELFRDMSPGPGRLCPAPPDERAFRIRMWANESGSCLP
jgi:hypothetical protein